MNKTTSTALIILDGWGINKQKKGNAILLANTPNFDSFKKEYSYTTLKASGESVGKLKGMMGDSSVGHLNIGAGRIVESDVLRITKAIEDKSFFKNKAFLKVMKNVKKHNSSLHLIGLLSDAGIHSYDKHFFALLKMAKLNNIERIFCHIITDGRDTDMKKAKKYIKKLEREIKKLKVGEIATIIGRYWAMDRDSRWKRTQKAYEALVEVKGVWENDYFKAIENAYQKKQTDEFIEPIIMNGFEGVKNNDSMIFLNFRRDRTRQLTKAFIEKDFKSFKRKKIKVNFACMTEYYDKIPAEIGFREVYLKNTLGEIISKKKLKQLRIAESEKYAHVTFFFNRFKKGAFDGEERIIIPSPKVETYDLCPEMSALEIKKRVIKSIAKKDYSFILINFANGDMVGHTGDLKATIKSIEVVDKCLGELIDALRKKAFICLVTADHGNAEKMIDLRTKKRLSEHSLSLVPFIIVSDQKYRLKKGTLSNIAPTILKIMKIKKPKEMISDLII